MRQSNCTTTACLCTTANANLLEACIDCIVNIDPTATLIASGQTVLDEFNTSCNGQSISSLTVSVTGAVATGSSAASTAVASGSKTTTLATSSTAATSTTTSRIAQITITQAPSTSSTSPASTTSSTGFSSAAFGLKETRNGIWGVSIGVVAGMALAWI
ncbi:hypothetical protein H0H93_000667 [Arthromyces matolae]|nr:hypothetical protein H0H93_000667 [Arthromyces matolae]